MSRGIEHDRKDSYDFFRSTARQQGDQLLIYIKAMRSTKIFGRDVRRNFGCKWASDILDLRKAAISVPIRLKRQDRDHQVDAFFDRAKPITAPCPKLG